MAALSYKISRGHRVVYPRQDLSYCANFLNMMFDSPVKAYEINPEITKALNAFWILHADHEQKLLHFNGKNVGKRESQSLRFHFCGDRRSVGPFSRRCKSGRN